MRLLNFDDFRLGVLAGDSVIDVTDIVSDIPHIDRGDLINGLIERFDDYRGKLEAAAANGGGVPLANVRIRPPVPKPTTVDCMAVNYMEDGTRDAPAQINAFHKSPGAIVGHNDTMILPDVPAAVFEGEAELAAIIGKPADNIGEAEAMDHIFGWTCFIDGSARALPPPGNTFFQVKSRKTFAPMGPWIVTRDEIADPQNLQVKLWNNGDLMQNFNTDDMAHKIPRCIAWLSSIHPLVPGDIVATGTNHRGLHPFQDGDRVELEIESVGRLAIDIRDDLKRGWDRVTRLEHAEKGLEGPHTAQVSGKYA